MSEVSDAEGRFIEVLFEVPDVDLTEEDFRKRLDVRASGYREGLGHLRLFLGPEKGFDGYYVLSGGELCLTDGLGTNNPRWNTVFAKIPPHGTFAMIRKQMAPPVS